MKIEKPPHWLLELATVKYKGDALRILGEFVDSEPFEEIDGATYENDYIGSLFLRYERRELSWATFLDEAGRFSDAHQSDPSCEYFFGMLNGYEDSGFDANLEKDQVSEVLREFRPAVDAVRKLYDEIVNSKVG